MEINGCKRKGPTPMTLDWAKLLPTEIIITSNKKPKEYQAEDLELVSKSYRELRETIARNKNNLKLCGKLCDGGEKLRANLKRHEDELERRLKRQVMQKVDNECAEMIQVSDSDDGVSRDQKQGDRKSLSSPNFTKLFNKKLDGPEDLRDSRTVNAFEEDLFYMKSCNGRRGRPKNQVAATGRSRMSVSSSSQEPSQSSKSFLVDNENQLTSNGDKSTSSFSVPNSPQGPPSSNLRPRTRRNYNLVDEDPPVQTTEQFMEELDPCVKDATLYYPSRDDPDAVEVNHTDMKCLAPEAYLSSTIMNFYIRYLQQPTSSSGSTTCNYHFFSTYFYNKLEKLKYEEDSFRKFRKWWKDVSIFEKAYILLPVHESAHWSLVIICFPTKEDEQGPILLHLDSLGLHNSKLICDNIKRFLKEEWSYLRKSGTPLDLPISDEIWENLESKMEHKRVTVPQQKNEYDCGLFVLFYMERFIKQAPERIKKKDLSMFGRQWFRPREASYLRSSICNLLVEEFRKVKEKESTPSSQVFHVAKSKPEDGDDRPPEIIITSYKKPKESSENSYQTEDLEMVTKSDRELNETIARIKQSLKQHEDELERRLKRKLLNKADNECEETIQVSDSDDGHKLVAGKGRSRMAVSSSSQEPSRSSKSGLVDSAKQITSNDDKSTSSFSVPNSPQVPPSSNLGPRTRPNYNFVDEDPPVQTRAQFMEELDPCVELLLGLRKSWNDTKMSKDADC